MADVAELDIASKRICLSETHGHIVPWDPPQFGIPSSVMEDFVEMLVHQVLLYAERHGKEVADANQQPSSQSDAENTTVSNVVLEGFDPYEEDQDEDEQNISNNPDGTCLLDPSAIADRERLPGSSCDGDQRAYGGNC